jgi:hypothetical protein
VGDGKEKYRQQMAIDPAYLSTDRTRLLRDNRNRIVRPRSKGTADLVITAWAHRYSCCTVTAVVDRDLDCISAGRGCR